MKSNNNKKSAELVKPPFLALFLCIYTFLITNCSNSDYQNVLLDSSLLGTYRGNRIARVLTHFHSPYSYDACDKNGIQNGIVNSECLDNLRSALCKNHIDMTFLTDHPDHMSNYDISDLLLKREGDSILEKSNLPFANQIGSCSDHFKPTVMTGFEGQLLSLGMSQHLSVTPSERLALYGKETLEVRNRLGTESSALVIIPHTESRTVELIKSLNPDGIEIYNIHANLDPKIRLQHLNLPPFKHMPGIMTYLIDPYKELNPDFAFLSFFEIAPVYFSKWNQLIYDGYKITGVVGNDSHENIFPQHVADGERFDSHRRISQFVNNHVSTQSLDQESIKQAIKLGRNYIVVEGLGTPFGFDYNASDGTHVVGVGESISIQSGEVKIQVKLPVLNYGQNLGLDRPFVRIELRHVLANGVDEVVASSANADLAYSTKVTGAYRAHVYMIPFHLRKYLSSLADRSEQEYFWIITNHIYITQ